MRNLKRWKRLMAVAMCSAMMLSVPMGVSATDSGDTQAPVTDNAEIVDTDTDTSDDTDTDTSDDTDTPDGSGDVTPPTDNDGTDTDAGDGTENDGTEEDGGEDTGKTKITLTTSYSPFNFIDIGYDSPEGRVYQYVYSYTARGRYDELDKMVNVGIVKAVVDGIDVSSAVTLVGNSSWTGGNVSVLEIKYEIDVDTLEALLDEKENGHYDGYLEISVDCNNDSYELDFNTYTYRWKVDKYEQAKDTQTECVISRVELNQVDMEELAEINKTKDIVIKTSSGLTYVFKKGDFKDPGNKDEYNFDVTLSTNFSTSGIKNTNVTADIFACRINYAYNGQLPGTAYISIPVDSKWNGRTLYYYQIMSDGTLKDTGLRNTVANGICEVSQSHCSDYVLLAKSPSELGIASVNGQDTNTGAKVPTSPKTGDTSTAMLFMILCMGACLAGAGAVKVKCNNR